MKITSFNELISAIPQTPFVPYACTISGEGDGEGGGTRIRYQGILVRDEKNLFFLSDELSGYYAPELTARFNKSKSWKISCPEDFSFGAHGPDKKTIICHVDFSDMYKI